MAGQSIMSIAQADDQRLIVGTLGGLCYLNAINGKSEQVLKPLNRIKSVRTMLVSGDDLWIGTNTEGLWRYNLKTANYSKLQHLESNLPVSILYVLWVKQCMLVLLRGFL